MVEKDGAWINDAKIAAGRDINQNTIPLKCEPDGVLDVNATISGIFGPIDVIVDNVVPVTQSGTWAIGVNNFPANQDVTVTNGAGASAVNIQDGGNSITVDGTVSVSGSVAVTGPLTDAQLRASPVPVTGTITTSPNVNVHDGSGVSISSIGSSLNVDVTNTVPVTLTSTTITGNVTVVQPTGTNLHVVNDASSAVIGHVITDTGSTVSVSNFPATQPISGTVTANQGTSPWVVSGTVTANAGTNLNTSALALDATLTGGTQQTKIVQGGNTAVVDATGDLQVDVNNFPPLQSVNIFSQTNPVGVQETPATKALYSFGGGVALAAAATDVFQLRGSGTKTVRILYLELFLTRTTVGSVIVTAIKRSTLDTGGTPLSFNVAPLDSNNTASTAIIDGFATNPTLGTPIGNVCTTDLLGEATGTVNQNGWHIDFQTASLGQGCVLRGANQAFTINFGGTTVAGGTLWYNIIWSEE